MSALAKAAERWGSAGVANGGLKSEPEVTSAEQHFTVPAANPGYMVWVSTSGTHVQQPTEGA